MKAKGHTPGAWFNCKRFAQRKAKGYALSRRFNRRLSRWFSHLLFELLPSEWYLRTQGVKLYHEPRATASLTYRLHGEAKTAQVQFGSARAIIKILPLWRKYGFCEPVPELSPYIPRHLDDKRYYVQPHNILEVAWYDPVLKDCFSVR